MYDETDITVAYNCAVKEVLLFDEKMKRGGNEKIMTSMGMELHVCKGTGPPFSDVNLLQNSWQSSVTTSIGTILISCALHEHIPDSVHILRQRKGK